MSTNLTRLHLKVKWLLGGNHHLCSENPSPLVADLALHTLWIWHKLYNFMTPRNDICAKISIHCEVSEALKMLRTVQGDILVS